ncbi:MAG: hypothetical protein SNJ72_00145 [Fimbriimonadales bacterium]
MTLEAFRQTLNEPKPPAVSVPLQALWYDAQGNWEQAHRLVQDDPSPESAWVHAYLHRKEGDISNAHYWYRRANKPPHNGTLEQEWNEIAQALLSQS